MNPKLERWWEALNLKGFKISYTKIEYINCNLSGDVQRSEPIVKIEA